MADLRPFPSISDIEPCPKEDPRLEAFWAVVCSDVNEDQTWYRLSNWLRQFTPISHPYWHSSGNDQGATDSASLLRDAPDIARFLLDELEGGAGDTALTALIIASQSGCAFSTCWCTTKTAETTEEQIESLFDATHQVPDPPDPRVMEFVTFALEEHERLEAVLEDELSVEYRLELNAIAASGDVEAVYQWALKHGRDRPTPRAVLGWSWAAERGDVRSMSALGSCYLETGDLDLARVWLTRAAEAGYAPAMGELGKVCIREGRPEFADSWFEKGAIAGDRYCAHRYAFILESKEHLRLANEWFCRIGDFGNALRIDDLIKNGARDLSPKPPRKWF